MKKKQKPGFEQSMIQIERDFQSTRTYAEECLTIVDKRGAEIECKYAPGPSKMQAAADLQRSQGKPVRLIALKARQVFISTWVAMDFTHEVGFQRGQKALVVSHEAKSAANIFGYYKHFVESYKPFRDTIRMLPHHFVGEKVEFEGGGYIDVATANNVKTGRSFSLRHLHLSEFGFYADAKTLMTGLAQAVPDDPFTSIVKESTAHGVGGTFYDDWMEANDPSSGSDWLAVFLAWWEHPEYVRTVQQPARFQDSLTKEEQSEQTRYGLSLAQLHWRRWAILNKCQGSVDIFRQEYPANAEEAFLFSGRPRFDHVSLARMPIIADPLIGELQVYQNGPRESIHFLPTDKGGAVVIYKKPAQGHLYAAGVDLMQGLDVGDKAIGASKADWSVLNVLDQATGEQVAKLRARMQPSQFAGVARVFLEYYNWAFCVPEINGPGISFIDALLREGYPENLIYHRDPSPEAQFNPEGNDYDNLGWRTTQTSKIHLIDILDQQIRQMGVIVRDANTLQECRTFVILPNGKLGGQQNTHDDEVIALALACVGMIHAPADRSLNSLRAKLPPAARLNSAVQSYARSRSPVHGNTTSKKDNDARGIIHRF